MVDKRNERKIILIFLLPFFLIFSYRRKEKVVDLKTLFLISVVEKQKKWELEMEIE